MTAVLLTVLLAGCRRAEGYTVNIEVSPAGSGVGVGGGQYDKGAKLQIGAEARSGYRFFVWNDGVTENPREITVKRNVTYTAHFVSDGVQPVPVPTDYAANCTVTLGDQQWEARAVLYRDYTDQAPAGYPTLLLQAIAAATDSMPMAGVQLYNMATRQTPDTHPHILLWYADNGDDFYTIDGISYPHWLTTANQVDISVTALDLNSGIASLQATSTVLDMRQESRTPGENRETRILTIRMDGSMLLAGQISPNGRLLP